MSRLSPLLVLACLPFLSGPALGSDDEEELRLEAPAPATRFDFDGASLAPGKMAVTPGGAQDISYFRDQVLAGGLPHPNVFTAEGLFSEHDLPLPGGTCRQLLCPAAAAMPVELMVQPEVRVLAQLGFHSGIDAESFRRPPLNLVAVVDKSGSMSGQPLDLVKQTLLDVADRLGPEDRLSVVLYGDVSHVWLPPTPGDQRALIRDQIRRIESAGSTAMEEGLKVGFGLATSTAPAFDGATRVMLFTDERPNVGRTDAQSFMGMAEAASRQGVGMTTIGVGTQFGAELATKVSSVRGGNLFFFADPVQMKERMAEEFDTMVTELAHDMELRVTPAPGLDLAGVYGLPGDAVRWEADGSLSLGVATLFPSKEEGGIYFAFAPEAGRVGRVEGGPVATIALSYRTVDGRAERATVAVGAAARGGAPAGLTRGALLVQEATVLKQAMTLHHQQNDQEGAYRLVAALATELRADRDPELDSERVLVEALLGTLAKASGHAGEGPRLTAQRDPVTGLPR